MPKPHHSRLQLHFVQQNALDRSAVYAMVNAVVLTERFCWTRLADNCWWKKNSQRPWSQLDKSLAKWFRCFLWYVSNRFWAMVRKGRRELSLQVSVTISSERNDQRRQHASEKATIASEDVLLALAPPLPETSQPSSHYFWRYPTCIGSTSSRNIDRKSIMSQANEILTITL